MINEKKRALGVLELLLGTSLVFLLLYRRYIFGNCVYLYADTGSDSMAASYPILAMLSWLFQNREFSFYTLFAGLGQDTTATFLQFLNPLKAFMLFFDKDSMPAAIMIQLYVQTVVSGLAFYGYIRRHVRHQMSAVLSAVIWPFISFTMLWSQNLSYGTAVCMFMVALFLIEELLDAPTLRHVLILSLALAVFVSSNYYFTYMTGVFAVVYIPLRAIFKRIPFADFLKGYFLTALSALYALLLAAAAVAAIAANFLQSARTGDVAKLSNFIPGIIRPSFAVAALARLFSENTMGIGSDYSGPTNYYEIAAIFTSALFLFAFFYFLRKKGLRARIILVTVLCAVALMHPLARYILDLSALCMRFSFMIGFLECVLIALFLDELLNGASRRRMMSALILTLIFTFGSFFALWLLSGRFDLTLSVRTMIFSAFWTLAFALALLWIVNRRVPKKLVPALLFVLIAGEILVMHHDVLYLRLYLTKDSFSTAYFSDGTEAAVKAALSEDPGLYRIATVRDEDLSNEGQVLHFNGMSLRNNTNPQPLIDLEEVHGTNERYTPYFLTGYPQYFQYALLAGKYIVTDETAAGRDSFENGLFEKKGSFENPREGVDKVLYEHRAALPFGYVYTEEVASDAWKELKLIDRMHLLANAWFYTDPADEKADTEALPTDPSEILSRQEADEVIDLTKEAGFFAPHNLEIAQTDTGLRLTATGEDPYVFVRLPESYDPAEGAAFISVRETKKKRKNYTLEFFYLKDETAGPDPAFSDRMYLTPEYPESLILLPEGVTAFRFDFDDDIESAVLGSMELILCSDPAAHLKALSETKISDISFADSTYRAGVDSEGGMLCIPLLYSGNWKASVNGEDAEVVNINGGLCGIRLPAGSADVKMWYTVPHFALGAAVSLAALVLWLVLFAAGFGRGKRSGKKSGNKNGNKNGNKSASGAVESDSAGCYNDADSSESEEGNGTQRAAEEEIEGPSDPEFEEYIRRSLE